MKFFKFEYTDAKNRATTRKLAVFQEPTDKVMGIDLSDLSNEQIALFAVEYDQIYGEYLDNINRLKEAFDVVNNFRMFLPERMKNVEKETL